MMPHASYHYVMLLFTCFRTSAEVAGAVFNAEAVAIFSAIIWHRIVAFPLGQLDPATAGPRPGPKCTPLSPLAIHLGKTIRQGFKWVWIKQKPVVKAELAPR